MKDRELDADLAQLFTFLPRPKGRSRRDHNRIILPKILAFDASKLLVRSFVFFMIADVAARSHCWSQ